MNGQEYGIPVAAGVAIWLCALAAVAQDPGQPTRPAKPLWGTNCLVYSWISAMDLNEVKNGPREIIRACRPEARDRARYGRFHEMLPAGGFFIDREIGPVLTNAFQQTGELTVEAWVSSDALAQKGPAVVMAFAGSVGEYNFLLRQVENRLEFEVSTSIGEAVAKVKVADLGSTKPCHIAVRCGAGKLTAFTNGTETASVEWKGGLREWTAGPLLFGDGPKGGCAWAGRIERVFIYAKALTEDAIRTDFAKASARIAKRTPAHRTVIRGRTELLTPIPTLEALKDYTRALVVNTYAVNAVLEGDMKERRVLVAQWAILDRKVVPESANWKVGQECALTLEPVDEHPELTAERRFEVGQEVDLPLFLDVGEGESR